MTDHDSGHDSGHRRDMRSGRNGGRVTEASGPRRGIAPLPPVVVGKAASAAPRAPLPSMTAWST